MGPQMRGGAHIVGLLVVRLDDRWKQAAALPLQDDCDVLRQLRRAGERCYLIPAGDSLPNQVSVLALGALGSEDPRTNCGFVVGPIL